MIELLNGETIHLVTFLLRFLVGIIIFGIAYQAWSLFRSLGNPSSRQLAKRMAIIFAVFGALRFITAFPDIYVNGLFSNIVNDICLGWFFIVLRNKNKEATERLEQTSSEKLSDFIEDIIHEIQRDANRPPNNSEVN